MHANLLSLLPALAIAVAAHPSGGCRPVPPPGKALYIGTNAQDNAVVALPIGGDGLLSLGGAGITTGGAGGASVSTMGTPNGPDALVSQGAVTLAGDNLFVVNAGSNSVSMFAVDPANPTRLTLVGAPAAVPGDFPNTVAASARHRLVCVATTGVRAGVACARYDTYTGLAALDALRPFALNQTNPPVGPFGTTSDAFFSLDEDTLYVTVKGDPTTGKTGYLASFPVCGGSGGAGADAAATVSTTPVLSSPNGTAVLFGARPVPGHGRRASRSPVGGDHLLVTDPSFGAAVLGVDLVHGVATTLARQPIAGQSATCWAALSPATGTAFVTDAGRNRLVELSAADASILAIIDLASNGDPGLTDVQAAGSFVYALSPGNGTTEAAVTVVDVWAKKAVQHLGLRSLGLGKTAQGLAVFV